ncbi:hypothetical protein Q2T76_02045 [Lactobacillus sp. YT155]|uniref:hypothetical protein n=1 Tax=Lactobacillus sp. YT155 TaxID=3060955 RepID=UPI00265FCAD1|nr:hypothetical protein [Lactobacillus sp. YT155]MDO1604831.1 hypothetical protein [Lactobacillus sp. YT155]
MFKRTLLKIYFQLKSKRFTFKNTKLNYIYQKQNDSSNLVVVFSAFPRTGYEATYNYLRTLENTKTNKLFILDNFGYQKRGCYYLGENGKLNVQEAVVQLIEKIQKENSYTTTVCVGSSKGGYAALMFGSLIGADYVIAGAPQYFLGNYLTDNPIKDPILRSIAGNNDQASVTELNELLPNLIKNNSHFKKVYLHYSQFDHTYPEHIKSLIDDLNDINVPIEIDQQDYQIHQEIRYWFPDFLVKSLDNIFYKDS